MEVENAWCISKTPLHERVHLIGCLVYQRTEEQRTVNKILNKIPIQIYINENLQNLQKMNNPRFS